MKCFLFDNDDTLLHGIEAHLQAFVDAFKLVYQTEPVYRQNYSGYTDRQIIMEVAGINGVHIHYKELAKCYEIMATSFKLNPLRNKIIPLPGAIDLVEFLEKRGIVLGSVTGNIKDISREKLRIIGLEGKMKFGGYGDDDHRERADLVVLAIERSRQYARDHRRRGGYEKYFLVGDTPKDIEAGREAAARGHKIATIGVASGSYSVSDLEMAGADYVFSNLLDKATFVKLA